MAKKNDIVTCVFKHCKHDDKCGNKKDMVMSGNRRYMHKDCYSTYEYMTKTRDLYAEKVNKAVVFKQLVSAINDIVLKKGVGAEFLYFALNYSIEHGKRINSPYGLHYIINDIRIKRAWEQHQHNMLQKQMQEEIAKEHKSTEEDSVESESKNTFKYNVNNKVGFGSVFG